MRRSVIAGAALLAAGAGATLAGLLTPGGSQAELVEVIEIGRSGTGRPISLWRLGDPEPDSMGRRPDGRPALLIVAGLDGRHDFGTRLALTLVDRIATEHADLLGEHTVYIVPDLNPDNDALFDLPGALRADFGRAPREGVDADRDRRIAEDPADDLNGDGAITMMRVNDPSPASGLTATHVIDGDDPRLMRAPEEGERPTHAVLIEGVDNDLDGRFNEDGIAGSAGGGVDLDRNFPSLWPEFEDGSGHFALSEPETRSLVEWMMERDNIVCCLAFTPRDNIINTPPDGKTAPDGREPTGIETGDKKIYEDVKEIFAELTRQSGAPKGEWEGSFTQWSYGHFGVYSFATPGWVRPDQLKSEEADADRDKQDEPDAPADAGKPDTAAERADLVARGVPAFVIDFLLAPEEDRAEMMAEFETLSEQEQMSRMAAIASLPEDIQQRVRARISSPPDAERAARAGEGSSGRTGGAGGKGKSDGGDDAKWLAYLDADRAGAGFVPWTRVDHPQLGSVEVGGFLPGVRHTPPEREWGRIADEQSAFVARILREMPTLSVEVRSVERVGPGLWRVRVRGTNEGAWPTRSAIGEKADRIPPIVVSVGVEPDRILSGSQTVRWDSIEGDGGREEAEWLLHAPDGSTLPVEVRSSVYGDRRFEIRLEEGE